MTVPIDSRRVSLPADQWRPMANEVEYPSELRGRDEHAAEAVSDPHGVHEPDDRGSKGGSINRAKRAWEYFLSNPNEVTVLLQRDHGAYWLLSREMFRGIAAPGVDVNSLKVLKDDERDRIVGSLRNEIDTTRHLLGELVAK